MVMGGAQCVGLLGNGCGWLRERWEGTKFFFLFKEREETEIRERGEIDCFFYVV